MLQREHKFLSVINFVCAGLAALVSMMKQAFAVAQAESKQEFAALHAVVSRVAETHDERDASKVSATFANEAVSTRSFVAAIDSTAYPPVALDAYNWRPNGSTVDLSEDAATSGHKNSGASSGVPDGSDASAPTSKQKRKGPKAATAAYTSLPEHFHISLPAELQGRLKFLDVRKEKFQFKTTFPYNFLNAHGATGTTVVSGYADSAFVLPCAVSGNALALSCLVVDWKSKDKILDNAAVQAQLNMEILGFVARTSREGPVLFVATDLDSRMRIWVLRGRTISEFRKADGVFYSISEGFGVVCALLPECIEACQTYFEALKVMPAPFLGDDDDDDVGSNLGADGDVGAEGPAAAGAGQTGPASAAKPQTAGPSSSGMGGRGRGGGGAGAPPTASSFCSSAPCEDAPASPLSPRSARLYDDVRHEAARSKIATRLRVLSRLFPHGWGENLKLL